MKKMNIVKWKAKGMDGKDSGVEQSIIDIMTIVLSRASNSMGSGIDQFRFIHRLSEVFDNAEKTDMLEMEDNDYNKMSDLMKNHLPAGLGFSENIYKEIEAFLKL